MFELKSSKLYLGDCREVDLPLAFADTVITDPPYELGFMNESWDKSGVAFDPKTWKRIYDCAKPGAFLFAFGGTRTYHRIACAIEDAGWQLRDTMMWIYATGFPKHLNISKAIDKHFGAERQIIGSKAGMPGYSLAENKNEGRNTYQSYSDSKKECDVTAPSTEEAKMWQGWQTGLKPAYEPIIVAMKPIDGTFVNNALIYEVAGLHVDACRIQYQSEADRASATPQGKCTSKEKSAIGAEPDAGRNLERVDFERPELLGRFPTNFILSHHPDCERDGNTQVKGTKPHSVVSNVDKYDGWGSITQKSGEVVNRFEDENGYETIENWNCHDECPVRILNEQKEGISRYFYCTKASKKEKNMGLPSDKLNTHKTVKPLDLMEYICRLSETPKKGIIFDPFTGSGSTAVAAIKTGRSFVGIELEEEAFETAKLRIEHAYKANKKIKDMFEE